MSKFLAALALVTLSACASTTADTAIAPATAGMQASAALQETALLGHVALTPTALIEDSRCPVNARCVWEGRLVLALSARHEGSIEPIQATLGEPFRAGGQQFALVAASSEKTAGAETAPEAYRFTFEAR